MTRVLTVLISHQKVSELRHVLQFWQPLCLKENLLLAYGGAHSDFAEIAHEPKLFVDDGRLRTRDHQRQYQSWSELFRVTSQWIQTEPSVAYIYLVEYDQVPLVKDLHDRMLARAKAEKADVLAHHLQRIDGTSHPHFLYHAADPRFVEFWRGVSVRAEPEVVLSMFGSGSFWRREAFLAVAKRVEAFPMYFEIYLPTLAHHLGYRVRDFGEQNRFVHNLGDCSESIGQARDAGAWTVHPMKNIGARRAT